jgi:hypothetical protein
MLVTESGALVQSQLGVPSGISQPPKERAKAAGLQQDRYYCQTIKDSAGKTFWCPPGISSNESDPIPDIVWFC